MFGGRLVLKILLVWYLATDGTYKLTWINFPVLFAGTTDKDRHFHPFGLLLSKNEISEDYAFLFQSIKDLSFDLYGHVFQIEKLLADAALAITNGFIKVFRNLEKRIVCWSHVERKIEEHIKGVGQEIKQKLINDFRSIQAKASEQSFKKVFDLLELKWCVLNNQHIDSFFAYFRQQWMTDNTIGWYEGYAEGYPSTNNGIESINNTIKEKATLRDRLPLRDFVRDMDNLIENWSRDRNPNFLTTTKFKTMPEISTHEWTLGFKWCKSKKRIVKIKEEEDMITCMVSSEKCSFEASKESCRSYLNKDSWDTFDEYKEWNDSHKIIEMSKQCWQLSKCSCPKWKKKFVFKHVIGVGYNMGLLSFQTLDLRIEKNVSKGR